MNPVPMNPISIEHQADGTEGEENIEFENAIPVKPRSGAERMPTSETEEGSDTEGVIQIERQPKFFKPPARRPQKDLERERMIEANEEGSRQAWMPVYLARETRKRSATSFKRFRQ